MLFLAASVHAASFGIASFALYHSSFLAALPDAITVSSCRDMRVFLGSVPKGKDEREKKCVLGFSHPNALCIK